MSRISVVQVGLGPLGQKITRYLLERRQSFEIVGAVDVDPGKVGQGLEGAPGVVVCKNVGEVLKIAKPSVAILTTVSDMARITPQVLALVEHGLHVVSTCEELSFPWDESPALARQIDDAARKHGVAALGTGINPGFLMDLLPIVLTGVCQRVDRIRISRIQNARYRRIPFQKKIGAGLTLEAFEAKRQAGTLRHVGLTESIQMIAARMGWKLQSVVDELSPIVADRRIETEAMTIEAGQAAGVQQIGRGVVGGEEKITLTFRAAVGEPDPRDMVEIDGEPNVSSTIAGGVNGDVATCAIVLNAVKRIMTCGAGLKTMADMPAVSYFE